MWLVNTFYTVIIILAVGVILAVVIHAVLSMIGNRRERRERKRHEIERQEERLDRIENVQTAICRHLKIRLVRGDTIEVIDLSKGQPQTGPS